jgi:hypothetical protein
VLPPLEFGPYIMRSSMDAPFKKYNQMYLKGEISFDDMLTTFEADVNTAIADEMGRQS